jgi:hypothetical protein
VNATRVFVVALAAALGVWVAIAAAQGGLGGAASGTGTASAGFGCGEPGDTTGLRCPREPGGSGGGSGGGGGGTVTTTSIQAVGTSAGHERGAQGRGHRGAHGRRLSFTFSVRLRGGHGTGGLVVSGYSARALPPRHAPASCSPRVTRVATHAQKQEVARLHLRSPIDGWCSGRYRVTVFLTRGSG